MTRILVRSPNWVGDQVLAYPFFHYLRKKFPEAKITALCVPWVKDLQFRNLVDDVVVLQPPAEKTLWNKFKALEAVAAKLRGKGPWDLAFSLPNSFSAAWVLYRGGAKRRVGYATEGRSFLLTDARKLDPRFVEHRTRAYVELLSSFGVKPTLDLTEFFGVLPEDELDPGKVGECDRFDYEKAWHLRENEKRVLPPVKDFWVLAPGSQAESRRWPERSWVELVERVHRETGLPGLIVGGVGEVRVASFLQKELGPKVIDLVAQGSIPSLSEVFSRARFTVSNDSGLAHVAALLGSSVIIPWGAGDPRRTRPIGPGRVRTVMHPVDCWPCERNHCHQEAGQVLQCLRGINTEQVWKEIEREFRRQNHHR